MNWLGFSPSSGRYSPPSVGVLQGGMMHELITSASRRRVSIWEMVVAEPGCGGFWKPTFFPTIGPHRGLYTNGDGKAFSLERSFPSLAASDAAAKSLYRRLGHRRQPLCRSTRSRATSSATAAPIRQLGQVVDNLVH